jgi:hypothetical protein
MSDTNTRTPTIGKRTARPGRPFPNVQRKTELTIGTVLTYAGGFVALDRHNRQIGGTYRTAGEAIAAVAQELTRGGA